MSAALRMEFRKFLSTRLWWILLLIMAGYMAFMAMVMGVAFTLDPSGMNTGTDSLSLLTGTGVAKMIYGMCVSLGYVFPAVIGTMAMTSDFRYRTITPTLLVEPRRTVLLGSKMLAALPIGLAFGLAGTLGCVGAGAAGLAIGGADTGLGSAQVWESIAGSILGLTIWCVVGVGFGALVRNQIAAIVILIAFTQLVEPIARIALPRFSATAGISAFLPGAAGDAIAGGGFFSVLSTPGTPTLNPWQGALVLLAYGLVFAVIGRLTTLQRDIE